MRHHDPGSMDIDGLKPAFAPRRSSPPLYRERCPMFGSYSHRRSDGNGRTGRLASRELLTILDGLQGIQLIGADVVEVAPASDTSGKSTFPAATEGVTYYLCLVLWWSRCCSPDLERPHLWKGPRRKFWRLGPRTSGISSHCYEPHLAAFEPCTVLNSSQDTAHICPA